MELCPIWKNWTIASISYQLLRKLGHLRIQVVPYVVHDTFGTLGSCWVSCIRVGSESVFGLESVHINVAVFFELCVEFFTQLFMMLFWEVSESICNRLTLLFFSEQRISFWGMGQMFESVLLFFKWEVSWGNGFSEIDTNDFSYFVTLFNRHWDDISIYKNFW